MDKERFWDVIGEVNRCVDGDDQEAVLEATRKKLMEFSAADIARWHQIKGVYMDMAYRNDLWAACRYAAVSGCTPVAVHLMYPRFLDDCIPEERELGTRMGLRVLAACDELWLCGERVSAGMQAEKEKAEKLGIPIRVVPSLAVQSFLEQARGRE